VDRHQRRLDSAEVDAPASASAVPLQIQVCLLQAWPNWQGRSTEEASISIGTSNSSLALVHYSLHCIFSSIVGIFFGSIGIFFGSIGIFGTVDGFGSIKGFIR